MIREISGEALLEQFLPVMAELEGGSHVDLANPRHVEWVRKRVASHSIRGGRFFARYLDDRTPAGIAIVLIDEGPDGTTGCWRRAELLDIGVLPAFRGRGYGSELLARVEAEARDAGVYCLFLRTYARNYQAIAFYGRNGYVPVAMLPDVHGPGDEGEVFLRKILSA